MKLQEQMRLEAAIEYWSNCRGKGTVEQRTMVERTLADMRGRLQFGQADAGAELATDMVRERD